MWPMFRHRRRFVGWPNIFAGRFHIGWAGLLFHMFLLLVCFSLAFQFLARRFCWKWSSAKSSAAFESHQACYAGWWLCRHDRYETRALLLLFALKNLQWLPGSILFHVTSPLPHCPLSVSRQRCTPHHVESLRVLYFRTLRWFMASCSCPETPYPPKERRCCHCFQHASMQLLSCNNACRLPRLSSLQSSLVCSLRCCDGELQSHASEEANAAASSPRDVR